MDEHPDYVVDIRRRWTPLDHIESLPSQFATQLSQISLQYEGPVYGCPVCSTQQSSRPRPSYFLRGMVQELCDAMKEKDPQFDAEDGEEQDMEGQVLDYRLFFGKHKD